jgi:hypothetical protein
MTGFIGVGQLRYTVRPHNPSFKHIERCRLMEPHSPYESWWKNEWRGSGWAAEGSRYELGRD